MAKKKSFDAKTTIEQVISQARDSMKVLGTLERQTLAKAKSFVKIPSAKERRRLTNDRILSGLKRLGVATQAEVDTLNGKVRALEASIRHESVSKSSSSKASKSAVDEA
jgi:hypothetical protein